MKTKYNSFICVQCHPYSVVCMVVVTLLFGVLSDSAQTVKYLHSGSELILTLDPGTYNITAYGAQGGAGYSVAGGLGAEMAGQFSFPTSTNLTLLVGGRGTGNYFKGGGGGGGSFVVNAATLLVAAGGGGGAGVSGGGSGGVGTSGGAGGSYIPGVGGSGGSNGGGGGVGSGGTDPGAGGGGGYSGNGGSAGGYGGSSFLSGGGGGGGGGGHGGYGGGGGGGGQSLAGGGGGGYSGGGGGQTSAGGGGGGSYIDSSAEGDLLKISGVASPDDAPDGEVIITAVQIQQPRVPPRLSISYSNRTATLSWQNVFAWSLQQNSNLANSNGWTASSGVTSVNDTNYLSVTASGSLFFRLQQ